MATRLSRMETLPDEAVPIAQWTFDMVRARRMTLQAIQQRLNEHLGVLGIDDISASALSRYAKAVRAGTAVRPVARPVPPAIGGQCP